MTAFLHFIPLAGIWPSPWPAGWATARAAACASPCGGSRTGGEIAAGRFDTRVPVDSGDDFEALGLAVNGMAERIGRQFHALGMLAEANRSILSAARLDR